MPTIAVSMGDPFGIGPEVLVKALHADGTHRRCRVIVYGALGPLNHAAAAAGIKSPIELCALTVPPPARPGAFLIAGADDDAALSAHRSNPAGNSALGGNLSYAWVMRAIESCQLPQSDPMAARAIVTGPISKRSWDLAAHGQYPGHTELLDEHLGNGDAVMYFLGPRLNVALVTVHTPLADVPAAITTRRVLSVILQAAAACHRLGPQANQPGWRPRVAVCGLNPHAGEDGMLGSEEQRFITPAIVAARAAGVDAHGPMSGDSIFLDALKPVDGGPHANRRFDLYIAMYHDQGLIPVKLLDRSESVNITLGLRNAVVRTSPAHGTAFDIAGTNQADPTSMIHALRAAERLSTPQI